jgi:hypothetical protein
MTDLIKLQNLLERDLHLQPQVQGTDQGRATLTVPPDGQAVLGPAGSQLVYTFQDGRFISLEIMLAAG